MSGSDSAGSSDWRTPRRLGRRGPEVTGLGLGCAPLGNLFRAVDDEAAVATVGAAWDAGVRLFDVAPLYGHGLAERRLGEALLGRSRDEFVVSTKVGRLLRSSGGEPAPTIFRDTPHVQPVFDFSRDGVLRSLDESLDRLALDRIDVVLVHDPDDHESEALEGAFPALIELRDQGVVSAVGAGMNQVAMLDRFVQSVDLDCVLLAGRYTLLDRSGADSLLPRCLDHEVGVLLGGVFNSGVLADPDGTATFDYVDAAPEIIERARSLRTACEEHGVSLPAAAVRFALDHPAVTSVVIGARSPAEFVADAAHGSRSLPEGLRARLDAGCG